MHWKPFPAERGGAEWDSLLAGAYDDNPFQSSAWANYKRRMGWQPQRWIAEGNGNRILCAVQLLRRPLPLGRSLLWAPGGPVINFPESADEDWGDILSAGLKEIGQAHRAAYVRFYLLQSSSERAIQGLSRFCRPPRRRLGSGATVQLDLSLSMEQLQTGMDKKHRYLVRRLEENGFRWEWGTSESLISDLGRLHAEMSYAKRTLAVDRGDLQRLASAFRENAPTLVGYVGDEAVTACLVLLKGQSAFYWRAATARKGREISAAYAMIPQLFKLLSSRGVRRFDFGGILPGTPSAAGINHFKQGFGGKTVVYLGEWEWSNSSWIRWGVNAWVASRRRW